MSFRLRRAFVVLVLGLSAAAIAGRTTGQDILQLHGPPKSRHLVSGSFEAFTDDDDGATAGSSSLLQSAAGYLVPSAGTAPGAMSGAQPTKTRKAVTFFLQPNGVLKNHTLAD